MRRLHRHADQKPADALVLLKNDKTSQARSLLESLSTTDEESLWKELRDADVAKAFWINLYNATVQLLLTEDPSRFDDRDAFFKKDWISVAGESLSLDMIEHGIIRSSKNKYTLGYTQKLFVGSFEEKFRLEEVDYRVHFALNCGAKSCPPVAIYDGSAINMQLDASSKQYLTNELKFNSPKNEILVPKLCQWFYGDFGGEEGIRAMLHKYGFEKAARKSNEIGYLEYDWTLLTGNYIEF